MPTMPWHYLHAFRDNEIADLLSVKALASVRPAEWVWHDDADGVYEESLTLAEQEACHRATDGIGGRHDRPVRTRRRAKARGVRGHCVVHRAPSARWAPETGWTYEDDDPPSIAIPRPGWTRPADMIPFCVACAECYVTVEGRLELMDTYCWGCSRTISAGVLVAVEVVNGRA